MRIADPFTIAATELNWLFQFR